MMSAAVKTVSDRRYGSVAELATYTGLSPRTLRRLIESGTIRALRVGRRVLVPFEDFDRHLDDASSMRMRSRIKEGPTMAIAPVLPRPCAIDPETGGLLPLTEDLRRARSQALARVLDQVERITDETDTDGRWAEVCRYIDEGRPHRPLFGGTS